jgi:hypothetical protein
MSYFTQALQTSEVSEIAQSLKGLCELDGCENTVRSSMYGYCCAGSKTETILTAVADVAELPVVWAVSFGSSSTCLT